MKNHRLCYSTTSYKLRYRKYIIKILFTPTTQQRELKSKHSFVPAALELLKDLQ